MRYCPDCGDPHECGAELARDDAKTRLELARIEADRDIRIAELGAQAAKVDAAAAVDIAAAELAVDAAEAEGRADGMESAIDDMSGGGGPAPGDLEGVPEFPVLEAEPELEPETVPAPPDAPPPPRSPKRAGWWDNYA